MSILPPNKPVFNHETVLKIFLYFFGVMNPNFPVVLLGIRNPKLNFYDDELLLWIRDGNQFIPYNFNADPSAFVIKGAKKAIVKKGVHFFKLSYHKISDNVKRRVGLRPNTTGEQLPVWRSDGKGNYISSVGTATNFHDGGSDSTWSEGCQTLHKSQYWDFIVRVANALGVKIQTGYGVKPTKELMKGIGNIPYILIDQKDYDYIRNLSTEEFDSKEDMQYQSRNFVNVPKVQTEKVKPTEQIIENASAILETVNIEADENGILPEENNFEDLLEIGHLAESIDLSSLNDRKEEIIETGKEVFKTGSATIGEAGAVVLNEADKEKERLLEAAKKLPDTIVEAKTDTGFLKKIGATVVAIITGETILPDFIQNGLSAGTILKIAESVWSLKYWIIGAIALWFVVNKIEGMFLKREVINKNTDPLKGNVTIQENPPKSFFAKLKDLVGF